VKTITAGEANRRFSRLLREVAKGGAYTIVSRGRLVAVIRPVGHDTTLRRQAKQRLLERLRSREVTGVRNWRREELYS